MSSKTKFKCDFCRSEIFKAAKSGYRGYCGNKDHDAIKWDIDPFANMNGPHICGDCVDSLVDSKAFNSTQSYIER